MELQQTITSGPVFVSPGRCLLERPGGSLCHLFRLCGTMTGWLERPPGYHLQKFEKDVEVKAAVDSLIRRPMTLKEIADALKADFGARAPSASSLQRYVQKWRKAPRH